MSIYIFTLSNTQKGSEADTVNQIKADLVQFSSEQVCMKCNFSD